MTAKPAREAYRARKIAAGFRLVHGRLTKEPRRNRRPGELPPHGSDNRYSHHGCRCTPCRHAHTAYRRGLRARRVTPD